MNKKELLKEKIRDFQNSLPYKLIPREISLPVDSGKIVTVTGVRRCGKTHVLYDTINHLISGGIAKEQILFLSFDDERFNFKTEEFDLILRAYRELFPEIMLSEVYIFFDEIQMADHWEQFVRRIYDSETKRIFLSGSNSKMLASDIATSLRGRTLQFEIFPLSFSEYCDFNALDKDIHLTKNAAKLLNASKAFVKFGSFPELSLTDHSNYDNILQEYYFVLLYKDIVERYNIRNVPVLKYFVSRLLNNLSKP
ncbi:MAG: ATP-binding protein, partial [Bacteroidetes bacterium]